MGYVNRQEDRYEVALAADLPTGKGSVARVTITNLSSWGCRFTGPRKAGLGDIVTVAIARIGRLDGQVRWRQGRTYGVRFDDQIPQVWLDHMRLFLSQPPALVAERARVAA